MIDRDPMLEPFDALIGTWATEATHPAVDVVVAGSVTFEWLEGDHFLLGRSSNEHELFPDSLGVIGAHEAGETYLRSLDVEQENLPESFRVRLSRALRHNGVTDLTPSPELEEAVYRVRRPARRE